MAEITAALVKELRELTGCGMMDCKKALKEANGDLENAKEILKQKGHAKSEKKAGNITAEGLVVLSSNSDNTKSVLVEINCQTDFVAKETSLGEFANAIAAKALDNSLDVVAEEFEAKRLDLVSTLGENITVRRSMELSANVGGIIGSYLHTGGSTVARIGALVALDINDAEVARDLAMHVAALQPNYISEADIPANLIEKETASAIAQVEVQHPGKPKEMLEKIASGKVAKVLRDLTLLGQSFVKDSSKTVAEYLKSKNATVSDIKLLVVGAGIEKKQEDFASEVMAQVSAQK